MNQDGSATHPVVPTPVAIIGMSGLFPKADGLRRYWANIRDGIDAITDVPETHWRAEDYYDPDPKAPDRTYARRGGFLSPVDFPALEFGIAPNNLEATDTTQLLGLLAARQALEDAGYGPGRAFDRDRVSVILGVTGTLELVVPLGARLGHPIWRRALKAAGVPDDTAETIVRDIAGSYVGWQENSFPGLLGNVAAGRIANRLDLGGTNCVIDAACASSLGALNLALLELAAGRADMVLTGGLDTFNDIFMYMCFSKTPALSPSGDARPFDRSADGTILGEGLGVLVLKRLDDARRDGDRVYAVIRSVGSSSDGKGGAVYAPKAEGQAKALRQAYELAGITPDTIELVEAHGTGTKVGDATELAALTEVFREARAKGNWCTLGSVKSQIGHTKAAAGAAGIIKAALALHHKVLPPTAKVERPADGLGPGESPFVVRREARPWLPSPEHPRRAAVSAFGFGGSNFHCVLEEADAAPPGIDWNGDVQIAAFSGARRADLDKALDNWPRDAAWPALCAAAAQSRAAFRAVDEHRLLLAFDRSADLPSRLREARTLLDASEGKPFAATADGTFVGRGPQTGALALVFPGQGSQYVGMFRELACRFPALAAVLADADAVEPADERLSDIIYSPTAYTDEDRTRQELELRATQYAQPAIGAASLGALAVLEHFGVRPEFVAGHSFGELTALCAAGRIAPAAFHRLARLRGRLMAGQEQDSGTMLAVLAAVEQVEALIDSATLDVVIANKNGPRQCVLSGPTAEIERAERLCAERGVTAKRLPVAAAFHSRFVAVASAPLLDALRGTDIQPARIPVFANTTAAEYPADADAARSLVAEQLARPVEFHAEIDALYRRGARVFLEVGPDAKLAGLIGSILDGCPHTALALDATRGRRGNLADLAHALATLAALGFPLELTRWQEGVAAQSTPAPGLVVKVCGANAGPRPAKASAAKTATPAAPRVLTSQVSTVPRRNGKAPEPPMTQSNGEHRHVAKANGTPAPRAAEPSSTPLLPPVRLASADAGLLAQALKTVQENLLALQQISAQTAEVHRQFLEGQDRAQLGFQALLEQQQRLTCAALGIAPGEAPSSPPALIARPTRAAIAPAPRVPTERPVAPARVPEPVRTPEPTAATDTPAQAASPLAHNNVRAVLIEVVSEKTGYPAEMLDTGMQLDADLGIDSIKRVEILSALQERLPDAPVIKPEHLGSLRTLSDIAAFLSAVAPSPEVGTSPVRSVLIEVVSEKTGYPADMLDTGMQLDADLGIDSIKRVEILSALQERLPDAPVIKPEHLGSLRTLGDIVDFLSRGAAVAARPVGGGDNVRSTLVEVVSEKTGYPAEMLDTGMQLEADLGIDSIKRVEILSALQERLPDAPVIKPEHLGSLRTLSDIVDFLSQRVALPAPAAQINGSPAQPHTVAAAPLRDALVRLVPRAVPWDGAADAIRLRDGAEVWVAGDGSPLAHALTEALRARGVEARPIGFDDAGALAVPDRLDGLVLCASAGRDGQVKAAFSALRRVAPALRRAAKNGGAVFATVSRLDGAFGFGEFTGEADPACGALAGLAKTAAHEWPEVHCKALDIEPGWDNAMAAAAVAEQLFRCGPVEVGLSAEGATTIELVPSDLPTSPGGVVFEPGEVVVITGGARGVTAAAAVALAWTFRPTIVLLGRSPAPEPEPAWLVELSAEADIKKALAARANGHAAPQTVGEQFRRVAANREVVSNLARLEAAGARAVYRAVDVRDPEAVGRCLDDVRREFGPVRGLIHGAGVLADRRIEDQTDDQFSGVYDTKVAGLRHVLDTLSDAELKAIVLFSSSTGRFGRTGQVAYAAANEVLNKVAQREARRRRACRVVAVNWGPWDGGMVTPALKPLFEAEGIGLIPLTAGAEYLVDELRNDAADAPAEVVILGPGSKTDLRGKRAGPPADATTYSVVCERDVSVDALPVLGSHVIDGRPVLPMALILEWLAQGAAQRNPGLVFAGVDHLRLLKGVIVRPAQAEVARVLVGKATRRGAHYAVPVEFAGRFGDGTEVAHARGEVLLAERYASESATIELPDLAPFAPSPDELYRDVLFHGPMLQGIEGIEACGETGIVATVATAPAPHEWVKGPLRQAWLSDPLAIDCAFQAMVVWCAERLGAASLPTRIAGYRQFRKLFPPAGVRVMARVIQASPHKALAEIELVDASGVLVARIDEYECVIDASLNDAFRRNRAVRTASRP